MERSPIEVAVLVIAGLIDGSERRAEAMAPLTAAVAAAVEELDPDHLRKTEPTWWQDLDPWARLDALDRLRLSHDNLLILEGQASEIVMGLRRMLAPRPVPVNYRADYARLCRMAEQRALHLDRLRLAERRLRSQLVPSTAAQLRDGRRALIVEEQRGARQRDRLGALLSMADTVMAS